MADYSVFSRNPPDSWRLILVDDFICGDRFFFFAASVSCFSHTAIARCQLCFARRWPSGPNFPLCRENPIISVCGFSSPCFRSGMVRTAEFWSFEKLGSGRRASVSAWAGLFIEDSCDTVCPSQCEPCLHCYLAVAFRWCLECHSLKWFWLRQYYRCRSLHLRSSLPWELRQL